MNSRRCEHCGDPFEPRSKNQRFCGKICGDMARSHISIEDVCGNCLHPRVAHFAGRGGCSLTVGDRLCWCSHFKFKRDTDAGMDDSIQRQRDIDEVGRQARYTEAQEKAQADAKAEEKDSGKTKAKKADKSEETDQKP